MKKICVVTGSRAEYGLLKWLMKDIESDGQLQLQTIVTGSHLSSAYGSTYKEIESDGFKIDKKIKILDGADDEIDTARSLGNAITYHAKAINDLRPDLLLVLGDRYEIFGAVSSALICRIPVIHVHGGETTEGAYDEAIRHSITKMSHLHFVATDDYRKRVIQLGEHPDRVYKVGGLGLDSINNLKLLNRQDLEKKLKLSFAKKNLLVTFHPVTLDIGAAKHQTLELLKALNALKDTNIIFTMPNADTDGIKIYEILKNYEKENNNMKVFKSLGQQKYFSCIANVDGVVGNSSSGIIEVPSFKKGTINIGDRQKGRTQASSIINCEPNSESILSSINYLYSSKFKEIVKNTTNPYGKGGASKKIISIIKTIPLDGIIKKTFYNLDN